LQDAPRCRLLYISSGGTLYGDTHDHPAREAGTLRPRSYYGAGKAAAEHFIHAASQQFGLAATVLRPSNIYGPGQGLRSGFGIIPSAFAHVQSGVPLSLWGDGSAVRDYLYIDDFIRLCSDIIEQPISCRVSTLNVASGQGISLVDLITHIRRITGSPLQVRHDLTRPVDIARIELNTVKVARAYSWGPRVGLEDGLVRTWRWWQARHA
jgi:UDP-glucose 4-epimerase